ncbi:MAG: methyltransferase domain-containing protein [Burkholderiales bacterium]|nr:methyltransferase domain-containing protein [Burkholderiales bacterium]
MALSPSSRPQQQELQARFARFRARARAPAAAPLSAAEAAACVRRAYVRRTAPPWVHKLGRKALAVARVWRDEGLQLREKLLATPALGGVVRWGAALVRLGRWRLDMVERLGRLEAALAQEGALRETQARDFERLLRAVRPQPLPPEVYVALEARVRGGPEEIALRLTRYLPYARAAAGLGRPCADLGCGRGEWLALLRSEGIAAVGVEANPAMAAAARARGLAVEVEDAGQWLSRQGPGTLALVSLFQVAEHLNAGTLWEWLSRAHYALAPGGWLIVETPNAENLQVAAYAFWLDPTHKRPLPPPLLDTLARTAGFEVVEILRHAPWPPPEGEGALYPPYLHKLLFCEQDYALIARKPEGTGALG